jgi:hypothetical protein
LPIRAPDGLPDLLPDPMVAVDDQPDLSLVPHVQLVDATTTSDRGEAAHTDQVVQTKRAHPGNPDGPQWPLPS